MPKTDKRHRLVPLRAFLATSLTLGSLAAFAVGGTADRGAPAVTSQGFLVQAADVTSAAAAVASAGGAVTHRLRIIDAVAARLTPQQLAALRRSGQVGTVFANHTLETSGWRTDKTANGNNLNGANTPPTHYPDLVAADLLHGKGITGRGVTIAVLDTGHEAFRSQERNTSNDYRLLAHYDAIQGTSLKKSSDRSGHGTHVTAIAVNSSRSSSGGYNGLAPDADLVSVRAFDENGATP